MPYGIYGRLLEQARPPNESKQPKKTKRQRRMSGDVNNNHMERLNGEIGDREKVVRGVKSNSPLVEGLQIYHNFIRPHMALEGRTPASVAGIEIMGPDKWQTIIQNASKTRS